MRRARRCPSANSIANALATRRRRGPCRTGRRSPNAGQRSTSHAAQIASPRTDREALREQAAKPSAPTAIMRVGGASGAGVERGEAGDEQQRRAAASHQRPCASACTMRRCVVLAGQSRSQAMPSTLSCSAYHGTSTKPRAPTSEPAAAGAGHARASGASCIASARVDVLFPALEQALARVAASRTSRSRSR